MSRDGCPIEQDTYDFGLLRIFEDFVATASPEIRREIQKRVEKAVASEDKIPRGYPWVDWSKAVDLGDKYNGWGHNFLYVWLNGSGVPFYVGQARVTNRPGDFEYDTRSSEFQDVIREGGCHSVVIAKHISQKAIDDLEKGLISYFCWKGYPLVNKRDLPSTMECRMAEKLSRAGKLTLEEVFFGATEYDFEFERIFAVLSEVVGAPWGGECAEFKPKLGQQAEKISWNGQEKTYREWSKEPGVSVNHATIKSRIAKGWTIPEAIYTPSWDKVSGETREEKQCVYDSLRAQARAKCETAV